MKHKGLLLILILLFGVAIGLNAQANGLDFDGNDFVNFGDLGFAGTTYTTEAWIYPTSLVTTEPQYCNTIFGASTIAGNYPMWVGTNGTEIRVWSYSPIGTYWQTSGLGLAINTWYHIAITATRGGNTKLYVNGVQKLSFTNPGAGVNWTTAFCVGDLRAVPPRGIGFKGKILDVRVWDNILTQTQIFNGMNNDLVGNEAGLIGYWPFNEGSGTTVADHAGVPHNGTLGALPYDPAWTVGITPYVDIASSNPAVIATGGAQGTTKLPIYRLSIKANVLPATINQIVFTTTGTYIDTDINNYKLWYSTTDNLSVAANIGSAITTSLGTGDHTFSGLSQAIAAGVTGYFWITADTSPTATPGATISVAAVTSSQITLAFGFKTGVTYAGGAQTFDETLPIELSSFTAVLTAEYFVKLHWTTQSETGVSGFYIYRGTDSDVSHAIAVSPMIDATNTSDVQNYDFIDNELYEAATYYYWLVVQDMDGNVNYNGPTTVYYSANNNQGTPGIPVISGLQAIYPNPFNANAVISYGLRDASTAVFTIYNTRGQIVRSFSDGQKAAGNWKVFWNGMDNSGKACSIGVYYIKMQAGNDRSIRKAVLIK